MIFIRVENSESGVSDILVGTAGQVLTSNGADTPPSFQDPGSRVLGTFSYTQPWEKVQLTNFGGFDYGLANFTAEFERTVGDPLMVHHGPGVYTTPSDNPWARRV